MEGTIKLVVIFLVSTFSALETSCAFLDVIPGSSVQEGTRIKVKCSEVFAYGISWNSNILLWQNSSDSEQYVKWSLSSGKLVYSKWQLSKNVTRSNKMNIIYTLNYEFTAAPVHNTMLIKCFSSISSNLQKRQVKLDVRKTPDILMCITNPENVITDQTINVKCWLNLGRPAAYKVTLEGRGLTINRPKTTFSSDTRLNYRLVQYHWRVIPRSYDTSINFNVIATNKIGSTSKRFRLTPITNVVVTKEPNAKLIVTPGGDNFNLHGGDKITCEVQNTNFIWLTQLMGTYTIGSNLSVLASSRTSSLEYTVPMRNTGELTYHCKATVPSSPGRQLTTKTFTKYIFRPSHRTFFVINDLVIGIGRTAKAKCHFLPGPGSNHSMEISIVGKDGNIRYAVTYNGTAATVNSSLPVLRTGQPNCTGKSNLFTCSVELRSIEAMDTGTAMRCTTRTSRRVDVVEKRLSVQIPPEVVLITPMKIEVGTETEIRASCLIRLGNPTANKLTFKFDDNTTRSTREDDAIMKDASGFSWKLLRIKKVLRQKDHGTKLRCSAKNSISVSSLSVPVSLKLPVYNLTITPLSGKKIPLGSAVVCKAYGNPLPEITMKATFFGRTFSKISSPGFGFYSVVSMLPNGYYPNQNLTVICDATNVVFERRYEAKTKAIYGMDKM